MSSKPRVKVRIELSEVYIGWVEVDDPADTEEVQYQALHNFSRSDRVNFELDGDRMDVTIEEVDDAED